MEIHLCAICGAAFAQHESWSYKTGPKFYCCKCWINMGEAPADWHTECLRYKEELNG